MQNNQGITSSDKIRAGDKIVFPSVIKRQSE
jgi:hypothetical protein